MKRFTLPLVVVALVISLLLIAPLQASAEIKAENLPVIGIFFGIFEAFVTPFTNLSARCEQGVVPCLDLPTTVAMGPLNGLERIVVTSTAGWFGKGGRDFGKNGVLANAPFVPNVVGWGGLFYWVGMASGGGATGNHVLGISHQPTAWAMVPGVVPLAATSGGLRFAYEKTPAIAAGY